MALPAPHSLKVALHGASREILVDARPHIGSNRLPDVVTALREALELLDVGNHHLVSGHRAALAGRLAASTDMRLPGVVFAACGSEGIDLAIKLARGSTGRAKIVSARGGYHGHTGLALAAAVGLGTRRGGTSG